MIYEEKIKNLVHLFSDCKQSEERYLKIISFAKYSKNLDSCKKNEENKVEGCQSQTYFFLEIKNNKLCFDSCSDALITRGLAGILTYLFNDESPRKALDENFQFLHTLKIQESLSFNRSNGLYHMIVHLKAATWKLLNHH